MALLFINKTNAQNRIMEGRSAEMQAFFISFFLFLDKVKKDLGSSFPKSSMYVRCPKSAVWLHNSHHAHLRISLCIQLFDINNRHVQSLRKPRSVLHCADHGSHPRTTKENHLSHTSSGVLLLRSFSIGVVPLPNLGFSQRAFTSFHFPCFHGNYVTVALSRYSGHIQRT